MLIISNVILPLNYRILKKVQKQLKKNLLFFNARGKFFVKFKSILFPIRNFGKTPAREP